MLSPRRRKGYGKTREIGPRTGRVVYRYRAGQYRLLRRGFEGDERIPTRGLALRGLIRV